jgi:pantothenate kinase type III
MITRFKNELETNAKVVATGGMSEILHSTVDVFDYVNLDLTLIGLRIITEMNNVRN